MIPAAHWAETTTVPAVGEVLRRDRQEAMECMSHDPDEISRAFKKHCSKCGAWNQVIVHRVPTDGDWDEAHPYFCAECGHQLGTERGFRISVEKDRD